MMVVKMCRLMVAHTSRYLHFPLTLDLTGEISTFIYISAFLRIYLCFCSSPSFDPSVSSFLFPFHRSFVWRCEAEEFLRQKIRPLAASIPPLTELNKNKPTKWIKKRKDKISSSTLMRFVYRIHKNSFDIRRCCTHINRKEHTDDFSEVFFSSYLFGCVVFVISPMNRNTEEHQQRQIEVDTIKCMLLFDDFLVVAIAFQHLLLFLLRYRLELFGG